MTLKPGDVIPMFNSDGGCIVLATSRHGHVIQVDVAMGELRDKAEDEERELLPVEIDTWWSHRPSGDPYCFCEDPESSWCSDGNGSAWIRVMYEDTP